MRNKFFRRLGLVNQFSIGIFILIVRIKSRIEDNRSSRKSLSLDVDSQDELKNTLKKRKTISVRDSIIKNELMIPDDSDFIDVCSIDDHSLYFPNNSGEIEDITINSYESVGSRTSRKRKREFSTKNLYKLYCLHCDKTQPKISGKVKKECLVCNEYFQFECSKCCKRYNSYMGIYIHLKNECMKNSGFERSVNQLRFSSKGRVSVDLETNKNEQNLEYSQLCFNCGITTNKLTNQTELCKAPKSLTCYACSFRCCCTNNLEYHMQHDHKISINYVTTSDSNEKEMSKSIDNFLNETSPRKSLIADRKKDIELYCVKCDNISSCTTLYKRQTCGKCNTYIIYQCKICKKRYTGSSSIYNHLKNRCRNAELQYNCSQCKYKAKQKGNLQAHIQSKHSIKKCTGCSRSFEDYVTFRKHQLNKCVTEAILKCYYCSYKTIFKTQFKEHIRLEHNSRYTCFQCGKKYINLKSFDNHQKNVCGSELYFECNHCSYSTNVKKRLEVHIKSQHSEIFLFEDLL